MIPRSLTANGIRNFAPTLPGVYGISNAREWIYIGETENIQSALLDHMLKPGTSVMQHKPTGFVYEVCAPEARPTRQDCLVREYEPVCNRRPVVSA